MKKYNTKFNCYAQTIELRYYDNLNIEFSFCCTRQVRLLIYPIEDVCKNFDKYYKKCLQIIKEKKICEKCNKYNGFKIEEMLGINNGLNFICSQNCSFCFCGKSFNKNNLKYYSENNKLVLKSILNSKNVHNISPSCKGEPFEDPYIKNEFLFNLHKSNIKTITFLTNATRLIDKDYLIKLRDYLEEHKITYTFVINLSGFDKETYESYCNTKFDRIQKCINNINDVFHDWFLNIHYIIGKHNCKLSRKYVEEEFLKNFPPNLLNRVQYCFDFNVHEYLNSDEYDKLVKEYLTDSRSFFDNIETKVLN